MPPQIHENPMHFIYKPHLSFPRILFMIIPRSWRHRRYSNPPQVNENSQQIRGSLAHSWVALSLSIKPRPGAQLFKWKWTWTNSHFHIKGWVPSSLKVKEMAYSNRSILFMQTLNRLMLYSLVSVDNQSVNNNNNNKNNWKTSISFMSLT